MDKITSLTIAVGVIRKEDNQFFITQRGENSHLAGYWEFPGGKVKAGETPLEALIRELDEEVDIKVRHTRLLTVLEHTYPDRTVVIHFFLVDKWDGEPFAREGQNSRWVMLDDIARVDFPDANQAVIDLLLSQ